MKIGLILSNDWELYGDGSGDYFEVQHEPLISLLKTVEDHGAKLTVMAELGQQWAHKKISYREAWAQKIVEAWESILKDTIKKNFDVQFHLHPQWVNAKYENGRWNLDYNRWAISSLSSAEMEEIFKKGKQYLENLLQPINPDYECMAFRAGAYCLQPSKEAIHNLLKVGLLCDTSITKGLYEPPFFDYRDAYSNFLPWFANEEDIRYKNDLEEGLLEIPIYSYLGWDSPTLRKFLIPKLYYLLRFGIRISECDSEWQTERSKLKKQKYPLTKRPLTTQKFRSLKWVLSKLITKSAIQLDYDFLPPKVFIKFLEKIYEINNLKQKDGELIVPIMASGHIKDMHSCENIDRILNEINVCFGKGVIFWTLMDAIRYWCKNYEVISENDEIYN